jgi:hypothetical protein
LAPGARDPRHQQRIDETKTLAAQLRNRIADCDAETREANDEARQAGADYSPLAISMKRRLTG